jgi:hypothetical protein
VWWDLDPQRWVCKRQILNFYRFQCGIRFRQENAELCPCLVSTI